MRWIRKRRMTRDIKHHLTDQLLMAYSAGALPEAFNLVIATHISMCDDCRARLSSFDAIGGAVLDSAPQVTMADGSLDTVLARIQRGGSAQLSDPISIPAAANSPFPAPLREYVGGGVDDVAWRKVGGGVSQAILPTAKSATVRLLRIPAGTAVPDHGHNGMELTLVLQGAYTDEHDRFAAGDIEIANEDLNHTPVAEAGEDCICLAATDAPLRFNSLIPRIAQRFVRI